MRIPRILRSRRGYTLIELVVASSLSMVVVLALGSVIVTNQRAWEWGRDKIDIQQEVTRAIGRVTASVRAASSVSLPAANWLVTQNADGAQLHEYRLAGSGDSARLMEDGVPLVDFACTEFTVSGTAENSCITFTLEIRNETGDEVRNVATASIRNQEYNF